MAEETPDDPHEPGMRALTATNHSFIMRIWREHDGDTGARSEWRGSIEHVASNTRIYFRTLDVAMHFVTSYMQTEDDDDTLPEA